MAASPPQPHQHSPVGSRRFFSATIDDPDVRAALSHESVYVRIGELLKAKRGEPIPKELIQIVAHTHDDWEKRLRELRRLGWRYRVERRKQGRRIRTAFRFGALGALA